MSNSFDWLTRLFCSFPNHDTTLTVILNLHFANKNAVMLVQKTHKHYAQTRTKARMCTDEKLTLINYRYLCISFVYRFLKAI